MAPPTTIRRIVPINGLAKNNTAAKRTRAKLRSGLPVITGPPFLDARDEAINPLIEPAQSVVDLAELKGHPRVHALKLVVDFFENEKRAIRLGHQSQFHEQPGIMPIPLIPPRRSLPSRTRCRFNSSCCHIWRFCSFMRSVAL